MIIFKPLSLMFLCIFSFNTNLLAQSTPPLDKTIIKPPPSQMTEEGRIQEKNDQKRIKDNSPDSDLNHPNSPNIDPINKPPNIINNHIK